MIDNEIGGMTWIKIQKGRWKVRNQREKEKFIQRLIAPLSS